MNILNWIKSLFGKQVEKPWYSEIIDSYCDENEEIGKYKLSWFMCVNNGELTTNDILALVDFPHIQFKACSHATDRKKGKYDYEFKLTGNKELDYVLGSKLHKGARFYQIGRIHS